MATCHARGPGATTKRTANPSLGASQCLGSAYPHKSLWIPLEPILNGYCKSFFDPSNIAQFRNSPRRPKWQTARGGVHGTQSGPSRSCSPRKPARSLASIAIFCWQIAQLSWQLRKRNNTCSECLLASNPDRFSQLTLPFKSFQNISNNYIMLQSPSLRFLWVQVG